MKRRVFLGFLAAAPAALFLPELLLPRKTFFLPPAGGWRGSLQDAITSWHNVDTITLESKPPFLLVGDIIEISGDPRQYRVTTVAESGKHSYIG